MKCQCGARGSHLGFRAADLGEARRGRHVAGALLFVAGFSVMSISYGTAFGAVGFRLLRYQTTVNVTLGLFTDAMGSRLHRTFAVRPALTSIRIGSSCRRVRCDPSRRHVRSRMDAVPRSHAYRCAVDERSQRFAWLLPHGVLLPRARSAVHRVTAHALDRRVGQMTSRPPGPCDGGLIITGGAYLLTGLWQDLVNDMQRFIFGFTAPI